MGSQNLGPAGMVESQSVRGGLGEGSRGQLGVD